MIVCIKSKHWKISKLNEAVFIDQNGHMVPGKIKAVIFQKKCDFGQQIRRRTQRKISTKDISCLVEDTSVRV